MKGESDPLLPPNTIEKIPTPEVDFSVRGTNAAAGATAGATAGALFGGAAVLGGFVLIGLTPGGPIAGSLFAANMGAGVAAGSYMAMAQATAMSAGAYYTGATAGGAAGGIAGGWAGYWYGPKSSSWSSYLFGKHHQPGSWAGYWNGPQSYNSGVGSWGSYLSTNWAGYWSAPKQISGSVPKQQDK